MISLDNQKEIKKLDPGRVGDSIALLADQMRQVLDEAHLIKVPRSYAGVTHVAVNGMGGSNLGAQIVKSAWADAIKLPIEITPGYEVPAYVGKNTLYIISSYSGTTEEPLSVYREVKKRGAKILGITEKGKGDLARLMLKDDIPGYIFEPRYNPSGQPRLGVGYSIFGLAVLMAKAGLFAIKPAEMRDVISEMEVRTRKFNSAEPENLNAAKKLARKIHGRIPVLVGAEHTTGNIPVMRNHFNESSKYFATILILPDLNHYAMEGLANPPSNKENLIFLFFNSQLYHPRVRLRLKLTSEVVKRNGIPAIAVDLTAGTKIAQSFEILQLGTWISYYLGLLYGVDPQKIPWVDWFKAKLK